MSTNSETDFRLLPKFIQSKRAILNPMNNDHCSFGYAIVLCFHPNEWRMCMFQKFTLSTFKATIRTIWLEKLNILFKLEIFHQSKINLISESMCLLLLILRDINDIRCTFRKNTSRKK